MALPLSDVLIPFVDANGISEIVATVLLDDFYISEIIEVTGTDLIIFIDIVNMISKTSKRKMGFYNIKLE